MEASRSTAWLSIFASTGTLLCCALPAAMVAVGAGAALSTLVSVVPQLVWLSEHKDVLFVVAGVLLVLAGWAQWQARTAPCPVDPQLRAACLRTRVLSRRVYVVSVLISLIGGLFAYLAPFFLA